MHGGAGASPGGKGGVEGGGGGDGGEGGGAGGGELWSSTATTAAFAAHPPRQVLNPASFLLRKESASLAALLAHALGAWQEHRVLVESEQVSACLARHDLYARQALRVLPSRSQLDLSRWAEAHLLLSSLVRDVETLPRFASHAQPSWHALGRLSRVAAEVGCTEEACFGLLTRPDQLSAELQRHEATATKLQRLLGWTPASAVGVVSPGSAFAGQVNN